MFFRLVFLLYIFNPFILTSQNLNEIKEFGRNDGNLRMFLYQPNYVNNSKKPLVVVLHGCSQNANKVAEQSGWNVLADENDFMVIYPEQKSSNNVSGCFNWFYKKDINSKSGESSSILDMIKYTRENYSIDSTRIFIYGLSAGAIMTVNLLANEPTLFKSGASLAGGAYGIAKNFIQAAGAMLDPPTKTPKEWGELIPKSPNGIYPKLVVVHGTEDNTSVFQNSIELVKQWTYIHQIEYKNRDSVEVFMGNQAVQRYEYPENDSVIVFYKIKGIRHALPVDPGTNYNQGGKTGMFAVDCDFFSTYYIAKDFGLIKD